VRVENAAARHMKNGRREENFVVLYPDQREKG
jgi:hypothetical protein